MNALLRVLFLAAWLVLLPASLEANDTLGPYSVRLWQTEEGLPNNSVAAITQTRDGFLWVGTANGLARFDGIKFTVFNSQNTPALKAAAITALCATKDGSLWIGTWGGGLVQFKEGVFSRIEHTNGVMGNMVRTLFSASDGSLWIGTTLGACQFKDGKFITSGQWRISQTDIRAIAEDNEKNLYFGVDSEQAVSLHEKSVSLKNQPGALVAARVLCRDQSGDLWLGIRYSLFRWNLKSGAHVAGNAGLSHSLVSAIFEDRRGNLWVGTYDGLNQLAARDGTFVEVKNNGESFGLVTTIFQDSEGNIWVGSKDGLSRLRPNRFVTYTKQHGLAHNHVTCVTDDGNGTLRIGTWGGGVNEITREGTVASLPLAFPYLVISTMFQNRAGELWLSSQDSGAIQHRTVALTNSVSYGRNHGYLDKAARVICQDELGNYWIGTRSALVQFDGNKFTRYTRKQGLAGDNVYDLCLSRSGDLWIGTETGLTRKRGDRFENFGFANGLSDDSIYAIYEDAEGVLWIGTRNGGLNRFKEDRFVHFTTRDGLWSDEIYDVVEDNEGWLWMTSPQKGIFCVDKARLTEFVRGTSPVLPCVSFRKGDGLLTTECSSVGKPSAWKTHDGRLWFATTRGLSVIDPKSGRETNKTPPPVVIQEVIADKQKFEVSGLKFEVPGTSPTSNFKPQTLNLKPGRGELEFHYTALSHTAPEKNQFKYKLQGLDNDWIDAGNRRTAFYNNVPPGDYTFHVIACNNDGVWNSIGSSLKLALQPHFWQTAWFIGLTALASAGCVAGAARYVIRKKVQRKVSKLEQQHAIEKERARIAADMHDDLGAQLTEIKLLGELAMKEKEGVEVKSHVNKMLNVSREVVHNLDTIVWSVNPRNDTLDHLVSYMIEKTERFLSMRSIRCVIDAPADLPNYPLSSDVRHNLYLTVKEAMNNIVKHAQASEVSLRIRQKNATLCIDVEDNGTGFQKDDVVSLGNGLQNMARRMEAVGGSFEISSEPGKGSKIRLEMPLPNC